MKKKTKNKPKQELEKVYCNLCQFYIEFSQDIIIMSGKDTEDGRDICGHSINSKKNHIGNEVFVTQGDLIHCEECRTILGDDRHPIYRKCKAKNRRKNCKDFLKKTKFQLLKNKLKNIIISIKNMLKLFNITKSYLLLFWLTFHIIFLVHYDIILTMGTKQAFYYLLITLVSFGVIMRKQ